MENQNSFIGKKIENLILDAYFQEKFIKINLADYSGQWLVLFFYPADFTFICPTELAELAELYEKFQKEKAEILSISTDTAFTHKAWHDHSPKIKLIQFPMVADPAAKLSKALGVYLTEEGVALRGSFIVDPDGIIRAYEIHDNNIGRSGEELLRKLQAAKFVREHTGEVCPASWKPGEKTLKPGVDLVGKI